MAVGPFPASQGCILTIALTTQRNRFEVVMPLISDGPDGDPRERSIGLFIAIANDWLPPFVAMLAVDCQVRGAQVTPMADDSMLPNRINYPNGTWVGTVAGESSPPQTSMLTAFYSSMQIAGPNRILVGKTNWGPPPEANCVSGVINAAGLVLMNQMGAAIIAGCTDETTGVKWYRALTKTDNAEDELDACDIHLPRDQAFTQKRRMLPLF
jgi:hypothetical protein